MPGRDSASHSDERLLRDARRGDADAFERFYLRHRDWSLALAFRMTRRDAEAADVVQEVMCRLADRIQRVRIKGSARAYLATSIRNEVFARARRTPALRLTDAHDRAATDAPALHDERLQAAVESLPEQQRDVLLLWAVQGLTHTEIAEALGIALGTVKTRARAALTAVRTALGPDAEKT